MCGGVYVLYHLGYYVIQMPLEIENALALPSCLGRKERFFNFTNEMSDIPIDL